MPELSRFYGIVVQVYYGDHLPAHFHVRYAGYSAKIDIETLAVVDGDLPGREELREAFRKASHMQQPDPIEPLP